MNGTAVGDARYYDTESANPVAIALTNALYGVTPTGRVPRNIAARLRAAVKSCSKRGAGLQPPEQLIAQLPAFDALPAAAQNSLCRLVLRDDDWSMWLRRASWRQTIFRVFRTIAARIPPHRQKLRHLMDLSETWLVMWHARVVHELYRASLRGRGWLEPRPTLESALTTAGLDARTLASEYLRRIPQQPDTIAYWHDRTRHTTVGVVVGIDFIVNDDGVWFVESNLNAGLTEERSRLYEVDPFVDNLIEFARDNGYRSLVFLACNDYPVDRIMAERIEQTARAAGIRATVFEDSHAPTDRLAQTFLVPAIDADQTLVVRSKLYHTTLDAFFHNKTLSWRALETYERLHGKLATQMPGTGADALGSLAVDDPFPNLVCKFPERDQGQGVVFLKVSTLEQARAIVSNPIQMNRHSVATVLTKLRYRLNLEDQRSLFQAYIPSTVLEGRRLFIARAHVLATPVGLRFLSAHRVVSRRPVPDTLPEGLVANPQPFIVNYSLDSYQCASPAEEERALSAAALDVARALCAAVEERFQTRPH